MVHLLWIGARRWGCALSVQRVAWAAVARRQAPTKRDVLRSTSTRGIRHHDQQQQQHEKQQLGRQKAN